MRKLLMFNMVSLDGFFAGPRGEIDWHTVDEEFNKFASEQLEAVDVLVFGRSTYQMMASYWPSPQAARNDPEVAEKMNAKSKVVFSKTLEKAEWANTRLAKGNLAGEISGLKGQPGRDLIVFGSANLAAGLTRLGLIDEYRIMVNPVVLGSGRGLFAGLEERLPLKLVKTKRFRSGNVLLTYCLDGA
jgi:dihydrofolate reductase